MSLAARSVELLPVIEDELRRLLCAPIPALQPHYGMMQYHMGWLDESLRPTRAVGGKRLRPLLCLLTCEAAGGEIAQALPAAAALELLHNFSLLHDDIEDESDYRRHRRTAWVVYGLPLALNAGDAMFSVARLALHDLAKHGTAAVTVLEAMRLFDRTCVELTEGQYFDMSFGRRLDVSVAEYFMMIEGKTGALLATSTELGALVAGAGPAVVNACRCFGAMLGRAFQLQDDLLGIWGDDAQMGKPAASDILSKKKSLPVLISLADPGVGPRLRELYAGPGFETSDLPDVLRLLARTEARAETERQARLATESARTALGQVFDFSRSGPHELLEELLDSLVDRVS